jgi:hypothetical protein
LHPLLGLSQLAAGLAGVLLGCAEILLGRLRRRPCLAKLVPCLLEPLASLLLFAFLRRLGALPIRPSLPGPLSFCRHPLRERREQLEPSGLEIARQPASCKQLAALTRDGGCLECLHDPVESGLAPAVRLGEDTPRRLPKAGQRLALGPPGLVEALPVSTGKEAMLCFTQPMACVEEEVDLSALLPSELIDGPRRDSRLSQTLDLLRFLALPGVAQLASEPVALGDERAGLERVEAVELVLEAVYSYLPPSGSGCIVAAAR